MSPPLKDGSIFLHYRVMFTAKRTWTTTFALTHLQHHLQKQKLRALALSAKHTSPPKWAGQLETPAVASSERLTSGGQPDTNCRW